MQPASSADDGSVTNPQHATASGNSHLHAADAAPPWAAGSEVAALAQELIKIDTTNPPGGELTVAVLLAERLRAAGIISELQCFAPGRANLVSRRRGRGTQGALMLSGHLDTVPADEPAWKVPARDGVIRDGRLYGRGALDMKGSVAAMVVAYECLCASEEVPAGDIVLALTAGEETDSVGAAALCASDLLAGVEATLIGEPTDFGVGIGHRGALWVRVEADGVPAHGSQPDAGVNAVRALLDWLHPFSSIESLVDRAVGGNATGTVSLNMIGGGNAPNVIPGKAYALLDFRTVAGHDHAAILGALSRRGEGIELTILRDAPPIAIDANDPLVVAALAAVDKCGVSPRVRHMSYVTDGSVFVAELAVRAVILGPGSEAGAHIHDESIGLSDLTAAALIYESVVRRVLEMSNDS
jgi:succinyl-diaminopimelate desuccinylase